ncbi:MAG: alanyl-tRNA editing protein [Armatimonadota bacterium]|nr:alanyl-tRNA editing protein [Armatimonadota bacterium]MDR7464227.1 alanyl-tRNA editing protein [Armatimonadota bacterium]MDR7469366.1 alanyl-tRNA editing protein [Armatimonadota bacterium]
MTERLYLTDAYLRTFQARVQAARPVSGGVLVELDRTAFYPTSGGQLHDTGLLGGLPVLEVTETDDGRVLHRLDGGDPASLPGQVVEGRVDWERRFDHMQQHTGQHLLSQAALRELGATTLAVHLGAERCTVDLDAAQFGPAEAARLEDAANAVVMENRPVRLHFVDETEVGRWGLRRPPQKSGTIRLVEIEGFDRSPCGGTHVRATGEVGMVAVTGWERYKGGTRVQFLCGWRALRDRRRQSRLLADLLRLLSTGEEEVVAAVQRLAAREQEAARRAEETLQRLLAVEAGLRRRDVQAPAVVTEVLGGRPLDEVRGLARALVSEGGLVVLLATEEGHVVFARSPDVGVDVAALLQRTLRQYGGRGGGRPEFAQGIVEGAVAAALQAAGSWAAAELAGA